MRLVRIVQRVLLAIPVTLAVAVLAFFSLRLLPGDPVEIMLGNTNTSQAVIRSIQHELHLDQPLYVQLALFLGQLAHGDLGTSFVNHRAVAAMIGDALPATIELTAAAIVVAVLIAVPLGIVSAVRSGSWIDRGVLSISLLGASMPGFWFGLLLILFFSVDLRLLPTSGQIDATMAAPQGTGLLLVDSLFAGNGAAFVSVLRHLVMPAVTLGVVFAAVLARTVRSSMVQVLHRQYVTTARAKGVSESAVILKHALRNALIPAVTVAGLQIGELLGGNMIVETVFAWPGLGRLVVNSIFARDYVVVQAAVMLYAVTYVAANLVVDAAYTLLDPQLEFG
ncbi:MAG TPA: ABC transporter permease [bacterium]|nr:ABC transporter permease [bacterium]